ncbi:hypothetical protein AB7M37_003723 [Sinorhizobium fredii]
MNIAAKKIDVAKEAAALLDKLGVAKELYTGGDMPSFSPVTRRADRQPQDRVCGRSRQADRKS